jgi:hypothetical protein
MKACISKMFNFVVVINTAAGTAAVWFFCYICVAAASVPAPMHNMNTIGRS